MDDYNKSHELSTDEDSDCRKTVKNILSQKIFVGEFVARRHVKSLDAYRDVVICSENETELIRFLQQIEKHLINEYGTKKWIGLTKNIEKPESAGYAFWCTLEKVSFGKHWFQVRSLKIKEKEIFFQLKCLRPYKVEEKKIDFEEFATFNLKEICTVENLCEASKFSMVLILTIATCLVKAGAFILDFLVKITHELSFLVQSLTPIIITIINTIAKCIGGFYWLLFMLWKGNSVMPQRPMPIDQNRLAIMNGSMYKSPAMNNSNYRRYRNSYDDRRSSGNHW